MKESDYDITELLENKSFDELSPDEKAFLESEQIGREEYQKLRSSFEEISSDLAADIKVPSEEVRIHLLRAFDEKHQRGASPEANQTRKRTWIPYIAAAAALAGAIWIFWPETDFQQTLSENKTQSDSIETEEATSEVQDSLTSPIEEAEKDPSTKQESAEKKSENLPPDTEKQKELLAEQKFSENKDNDNETKTLEIAVVEKEESPEIASFDVAPAEELKEAGTIEDQESNFAQNLSSASRVKPNSLDKKRSQSRITLQALGGPYPNAYVGY